MLSATRPWEPPETLMDNKLAVDEARRVSQYGSLKAEVEARVDSHISAQAQDGLAEEAHIGSVASQIRRGAIDEIAETDRELRNLRTMARVGQVVDYVFYVFYALLGLRFLLAAMAARESAGFVRFVKGVSDPLFLPFRGIVSSPELINGGTLALPLLLAIGVYALLHLAVKGLLRMIAQRRTEI